MAQAKQPPAPEYIEATLRLTHNIETSIRQDFLDKIWNPILTKEHLQRLHVHVRHLGLDDADSLPMVRPVPLRLVAAWLEEQRPWEDRGFGRGRVVDGLSNNAWWNARTLKNGLVSYITYGQTTTSKGIMRGHTGWRRRLERPQMMLRDEKMWYDVALVLDHADKSFTHITGILMQDLRLPKELTAFELFAMANLTDLRILDGALNHQWVVPMTLISIGDCNIRVIHGFFDGLKGEAHLQMSDIVNFDRPNGSKEDSWRRILCWLLAEPLHAATGNGT